jgi:hypothetical protein
MKIKRKKKKNISNTDKNLITMYTMFFKRDTWIVIFQLILIVFLTLWLSTTSLAPANPIEGFHQMSTPLEYTAVGSPNNAYDDTGLLRSINGDNSQCKKVGGFSGYGVFCTPDTQPQQIDIYSQAKGDLTCQSVGLSNSKGPLCLDDNMKRMLGTRGANAQGGFGQIGSS